MQSPFGYFLCIASETNVDLEQAYRGANSTPVATKANF